MTKVALSAIPMSRRAFCKVILKCHYVSSHGMNDILLAQLYKV